MSEIKTNKISSLDSSNSDITLDPDGTGDVVVAAGHKLGAGTASPSSALHVYDGSNAKINMETSTNTAFIGNISGSMEMQSADIIKFLTSGANERMRIDTSGNLQVGTTAVTPNPGVSVRPAGNVTCGNSDGASGFEFATFRRNGTQIGSINQTGTTGVAYNTSSDHRLKENAVDMTGAITRVKQLAPKRFNFIADDSVTVDGFMAHEAQVVVPEAVTGTHNEVDADGNAVMQGIDQSKLVPLLTGALQEAIVKIEALEARVTALENA